MMFLSWPLWLAVATVPLLSLDLGQKALLAAALFATSYALW